MSTLGLGYALSGAVAVGIAPPPLPPQPALLGSTDETITSDAQTGEITIVVADPPRVADTYVLSSAQLRTGPVNLMVPALMAGPDPIVGDTLTREPGLWIYDADLGQPTLDVEWQADTATDGLFADAIGTGTSTHTLTNAQAGTQVRVQETAMQTIGTATAQSTARLIGAWSEVITETVQNSFSLNLISGGEFEINNATGMIDVTITTPPQYAGNYITNTANLAAGPVNLVLPVIVDNGTPENGETLTVIPGLWIYDPDNGGLSSPSCQWQSDTLGDATFADIAGATSASFTLTVTEQGDDVHVVETLADNNGSRSVNSAAVSVAPAAASGLTFIETFDTYSNLDDIPTVNSTDWEYLTRDSGGGFIYLSATDVGSIDTTSGSVSVNVAHPTAPNTSNQYAEFTYLSDKNGGTLNFSAAINIQPTSFDLYEALYNETNDNLVLRLNTTGGNTVFGTHNLPTGGLVAGDIVRVERSGSSLSLKLNGTTVITGTNSSLSGGKIGLTCFFANSTRNIDITRFEGGDL
jgi:hypothetical protein